MPSWLLDALKDNEAVLQVDKGGEYPLTSLMEEAVIIAASYLKNPRPLLVVKNNLYQAQRLFERISSFLDESQCALFGADESLRVEAIAASPEITAAKVETLASLCVEPRQVVITCPTGLLRFLPAPEDFKSCCIHLKVGDEVRMEDLKKKLIAGGYQQTAHIDQPLTFAARGGIVDVYSINYPDPIRIEFFDTEVESIRFFNIQTQKTTEYMNEARIVPATDVLFTDEEITTISRKAREMLEDAPLSALRNTVETDLMAMESHVFEKGMYQYFALLDHAYGIWDYMARPTLVVSDEELIRASIRKLNEETIVYVMEMANEGKMLSRFVLFHDFDRIPLKVCRGNPFADNIAEIEEIHVPNEPLEGKLALINLDEYSAVYLPQREFETTVSVLNENNIPYVIGDDTKLEKGINLFLDNKFQGFRMGEYVMYTSHELFEIHHHAGRYENKFRNAEIIHGYDELEPGDYVVHATYGVGQYIGIETREVQGNMRDFLHVVYKGNAELFVPLEQFRLVRKFVSREGVVPRLNKLGSKEWEKTKKKLEKNVNNIAERLVELYSQRKMDIGFAFSPDNDETRKFERAFPHELTPDQQKAVEDVKRDMESILPMDRLICGDVGFGKTEVAVRASFKAVCDNKQVAVLCPTTILAEQHFHTFSDRYKGQAVTIRCLDRFVPVAKQKETLRGLQEGTVDIVIGTHRLLSKDVKYKDLGLLVVDEEQRFGVEHKEKIKELKTGVDVLTLSATPIPRTLQMSLVGIRGLSQLDTPPLNRYSVQTYVVEQDDKVIKSGIEKELARDGQVFYLFNNIDLIAVKAMHLKQLVPYAKIDVVHGRMTRDAIEDVMYKFTNHEIDVLVCTTIVENGIDIPNVNTIFVEGAHLFGLSQLYQIKGRVGRSARLAYAYLMVPERKQLSDVAEKRLQAIKEFARLGSGYKIAMKDLTIRGAGDMLGANQSGFIDTVGIDMYIEMLNKAIEAHKKGETMVIEDPKARLNVNRGNSYIPAGFTDNDYDKLDLYHRLDEVTDSEELEDYRKSVVDQYGKLPKEVEMLFTKRQYDFVVSDPVVKNYRETDAAAEITLSKEISAKMDGLKLFRAIDKLKRDIDLNLKDGSITINVPKRRNYMNTVETAINIAKESRKA